MATTRVGLTGPMTAYAAFDPKEEDGRGSDLFTRVGLTGPMTKYQTFLPKGEQTGKFYIFGGAIVR